MTDLDQLARTVKDLEYRVRALEKAQLPNGMKRQAISFSGGRTSAYMTKRLFDDAKHKPLVLFANTGLEDQRTLDFVHECDTRWDLNVIWLEAKVKPGRVGTSFRVVSYGTASKRGEPFHDMIKKYGIPNKAFPHCTRELKQRPINAFLRHIGWEPGSFEMAIGIRADEIDRMSPNASDNGLVYPLVKWGARKQDVLSWWAQQEFDLNVPEHRGNCVTCWKKSDRKLFTIARETPDEFDFFRVMEYNYADVGAGSGGRVFFRSERSTEQMLDEARKPFRLFEPDSELQLEMDMLDLGGGCGESCEVFSE